MGAVRRRVAGVGHDDAIAIGGAGWARSAICHAVASQVLLAAARSEQRQERDQEREKTSSHQLTTTLPMPVCTAGVWEVPVAVGAMKLVPPVDALPFPALPPT